VADCRGGGKLLRKIVCRLIPGCRLGDLVPVLQIEHKEEGNPGQESSGGCVGQLLTC
jgi:hypothetical protein